MPGGQRTQTAAIVFTDMVGSTALRMRVGDEFGERIRREHDALLTAAIDRNGGELVKHLGDGVMAAFPSVTDAVTATVQIQQAIVAYNRRPLGNEPLALRIGVSAGDVQWDDGDYFGTPVVEAARLEAAAEGGQILVSQVVQVLAGRGEHRFEPVGLLELKGLGDPIPAAAVVWAATAVERLPLPRALAGTDPSPFVGRSAERQQIRSAWDDAIGGHRRVLFVSGEAGVGKSALVSEAARDIHGSGAIVLFGRCDEGLSMPYQPVVEALRHHTRALADADLPSRLGELAGELVRILPDLAQREVDLPPQISSEPEIEQYRLFEAVVGWIEATTDLDGPMLLVVDDLHWATPHTTRMLRHVLDRTSTSPVLVLATFRDGAGEQQGALTKLVGSLGRLPGVDRMPLQGLGRADLRALVGISRPELPDGEAASLAAQVEGSTGGNAFFARELIRHIAEPSPDEDVAVPMGIREMLDARLAGLAPATRELLAVGSAMGLEFDINVLRAVTGLDEEPLWNGLEEAEAAGMIGQGSFGRCQFSHALLQAALYDELGFTRRVRLHQRVADAIESVYQARLPSRHGELAYHLDQAGLLGDPEKAVRYAVLAGHEALDQYASEEAARHFEAALRHLTRLPDATDTELHNDILLALGRAQARLDLPGYRTTLHEAATLAVARGDLERTTQAIVTAGRGFASRVGEVDATQVEMLERAIELAGSGVSPARAMLLARLGAELSYATDPQRPLQVIDEALDVARSCGDARALAFVLATAYAAVWREHMYSDELRALADEIGDPGLAFLAEHQRSNQASWEGNRDLAESAFAESERIVVGIGDRRAVWLVELTRAKHAMMRGDVDLADELAAKALQVGQSSGQPDAFAFYASQLLVIRWLACRHGELAPLVEAADDALSELPAFRAARALVFHEVGRVEEAAAEMELLQVQGFANQPVAGNPIVPWFVLGQLCAELGDEVRAHELLTLLEPHAHLHGGSVNLWVGPAIHPVARLRALVGRDVEADEGFRRALDVYGSYGCRQMHALAAVHWAEALTGRAARGVDVDAALVRALTDEALLVGQELGLDRLTERARAATVALPSRPI